MKGEHRSDTTHDPKEEQILHFIYNGSINLTPTNIIPLTELEKWDLKHKIKSYKKLIYKEDPKENYNFPVRKLNVSPEPLIYQNFWLTNVPSSKPPENKKGIHLKDKIP